jgi:hypothetical protein
LSWNEGLTISIVSPYFFAIRHMLCRGALIAFELMHAHCDSLAVRIRTLSGRTEIVMQR